MITCNKRLLADLHACVSLLLLKFDTTAAAGGSLLDEMLDNTIFTTLLRWTVNSAPASSICFAFALAMTRKSELQPALVVGDDERASAGAQLQPA
jgi:hypothetical protein